MDRENALQDRCHELDRATRQLQELVADAACDELFAGRAQVGSWGVPEVVVSLEMQCHGFSFGELAEDLQRKLQRSAELIQIRKCQWKSI